LEGESYPDALIETPSYILVVEGKRTERKPTIHTSWMRGRHQLWRHMDAALEIAANRPVLGLMIVEGPSDGSLPKRWLAAVRELTGAEALESSLPHRSPTQRAQLADGFLGLTTWQRIAIEFGLAPDQLPDVVTDLPGWYMSNGLVYPTTEFSGV